MYNKRAFFKNWSNHNSDNHKSCGGHSRKKAWKEKFKAAFNTPPANVQETDAEYQLHLFAPGFEKGDFDISIIDQTLSISVEKASEQEGNWRRVEYTPSGFSRQFGLNEKVDTTAIKAKYENGVLIVSLPKLDGFETERQEIKIS